MSRPRPLSSAAPPGGRSRPPRPIAAEALSEASSAARRVVGRDPGYMQWHIAETLRRVRAELSDPATTNAADAADRSLHTDRLASADAHARASRRWATRARTLTREAQLRAAMPVTDRIQETLNTAAHRLAQPPSVQESPTRPPRARIHDRYLDHHRISDRGRGYDLGR